MLPEKFDKRNQVESAARQSRFAVVSRPEAQEYGPPPADSAGLGDLITPLWRGKWVIALAAVVGLGAGLGATLLMKPVYRARTSVEIKGFNDQNFLRELSSSSSSGAGPTLENQVQNEVKLLQSDSLAKRVAARLPDPPSQQPEGQGGLRSQLRERLTFLLPKMTPEERRVRGVQNALTVRTSLQSQVVDVFFEAPEPSLAAFGANAVVAEFIEMNREARWRQVQDTTEWLSKQTADLKEKLDDSTRRLQDYARSAGLVFAGSQSTLAQERMRQLEESLSRAQADRAAKQSRYEAAVASLAGLPGDESTAGVLRQYETDLEGMRRRLAELELIYTPEHAQVKRLKAQIAQTESAIRQKQEDAIARVHADYLAAVRLERLLTDAQARQLSTVEGQMEKERQYAVLRSEAESTQRLYDTMLQRVKEAGVASALRTSNIMVIDRATPPSVPYSPRPVMNLAIGLFLGIMGGAGLVFIRKRSGFVTLPAEARLPDIPLLGVIPSATDPWTLGESKRRLIGFRPKAELGLVTWERDTSLVSESFRAALTSILFTAGLNGGPRQQNQWEDSRVVVVTSIDMMEGKSTVLSNLGIALAETKRRALLIDADLRRPRLHEIFNICNDWGLTDLLQSSAAATPVDEAPLETLARRTHIPDLWILPSGPGSAAISGLLHSVDLEAMLRRFRREFDLVLIDTPPMTLYPDARILGRASDGVVMVVRANRQSRGEMQDAYLTLIQDQIPVLGTILNDWKMDPGQTRAYGRRYGDYRHRAAK